MLDGVLCCCRGVYWANLAYLEALLAGLDGGDITGNTATDDNKVLFLCAKFSQHFCFARRLAVDIRAMYPYQSRSRNPVFAICAVE
jgi:hypothetical protein